MEILSANESAIDARFRRLGRRLRARRTALGKSARAIAAAAGISAPYLLALESALNKKTQRPSRPSMEILERLAAALELSSQELLLAGGYSTYDSAPEGRHVPTREAGLNVVSCLSWSEDGRHLAIAGEPGHLQVVEFEWASFSRGRGPVIGIRRNAHVGGVDAMCWVGDSICTAGRDELLRKWNARRLLEEPITINTWSGSAVLVGQAGGELMYVSRSGKVVRRAVQDLSELAPPFNAGVGPILCAAFTPGPPAQLFFGHPYGRISRLELYSAGGGLSSPSYFPAPTASDVTSIAVADASGSRLQVYAGHSDGRVRVWGTPVLGADVDGGLTEGEPVAFLDENRTRWRAPRMWDDYLESTEGHLGKVNSLAVAPEAGLLATGGPDHRVKLWRLNELASGSLDELYCGPDDSVTALAFSPHGEFLACAVKRGDVSSVVVWWVYPREPAVVLEAERWREFARRPVVIPDFNEIEPEVADRVPVGDVGFSRREF